MFFKRSKIITAFMGLIIGFIITSCFYTLIKNELPGQFMLEAIQWSSAIKKNILTSKDQSSTSKFTTIQSSTTKYVPVNFKKNILTSKDQSSTSKFTTIQSSTTKYVPVNFKKNILTSKDQSSTSKFTTIQSSTTKYVPVNFKQNYTINKENACSKFIFTDGVILMIGVVSDPRDPTLRSFIRTTWGNVTDLIKLRTVILFFVGQIGDPSIQKEILKEDEEHQDIVQGNYSDSFRNLTYKTMSMLLWADEFCPRARFVLKVDNDMVVHTFKLVRFLRATLISDPNSSKLICMVFRNNGPVRTFGWKWSVGTDEYPGEKFPDYCCGRAYLIPMAVIPSLFDASRSTNFLSMEDVFVTGLLAEATNISHRDVSSFYTDDNLELLIKQERIFSHTNHDTKTIITNYEQWQKLKSFELSSFYDRT